MGSKKVFILLTDTGTIFTRFIKLYTKKPYNHASLCLDENFHEVYSFGRKRPRNPFIGGFVKEDMQSDLFKNARGEIYSCVVTEDQYERMKSFLEKIEKEKHLYRYNLLGVITYALSIQISRNYAYFCSEFVASVLHEGGAVTFKKPLSLISPHDLQQIEKFHLEYEGELANRFSAAGYSFEITH